ncbi:hypothetical protein CsatB_022814 [Cannabis sativa]
MVETRSTRQPRPLEDAQDPNEEDVASRAAEGSEEEEGIPDDDYEGNLDEYAYDEGSYSELVLLRQKAIDHEAEIEAQKAQNQKMQEVMLAMQKAMEAAGIHVHPKAMTAGLGKEPEESSPSTQQQKSREPSPIRYPAEGNQKKNPTSTPGRKKKAQDPRKVRSDFPKGKGPQRGKLQKGSLGPQDREDRKSVSVHQEPGGRGRRGQRFPPVDLRNQINGNQGDLRDHLDQKRYGPAVSTGTLNEGIMAELAIFRKDIA